MKKLVTLGLLFVICLSLNAQYIKLDASFYSEALDEMKNVDIYLPSDYYNYDTVFFPVIYYLHGGGGDQNSGNQFASHYYYTHAENPLADSAPAAIFVCADGSYDPYYGGYWVNSELFGNHEDYVINDLISFIESEFRARSDRNFRFITGYSMGGFGSTYLALSHPDIFRACSPMSSAYLTFADTVISSLEESLLEENGDYHFSLSAGRASKFFLTLSGAISPNMEIEPYPMELLWDTNGNWVDTVWVKWQDFDCSAKIKNLTSENKLDFFLSCGTEDDIICYPPYLQFEDTLTKYNIDFVSIYNEYIHGEIDIIANALMWNWMDSLAYISLQHVGVNESHLDSWEKISLFPNPITTTAKLRVPNASAGTRNIWIYTMTGICLKSWEFANSKSGQQEFTLNLNDLPAGVYFLKLNIDKEVLTKKFIKY